MTSSAAMAAPPSPAALDVLSGLLRDAVLLAGRGTASPADVDTAMRLGAGHPAGPFEVLASLGPGPRGSLGLPGPLPEAPASGPTAAPADGGWTGPVGVLGTGHMAGGIVEAVARSGRPVRVLARSEASGARLLGTLGKSLTRAVSRGRLDEATRGRVPVGHVTFAVDSTPGAAAYNAAFDDRAERTAAIHAVTATTGDTDRSVV